MKNTIGIILSILAGIFVGFFGVIVSVFADSNLTGRLMTIGVILLIYMALSGILGFLFPRNSWRWGFYLGGPGFLFLIIFMIIELNLYILIYMFLIICFACTGAWIGSIIKKRMIQKR